MAENAFDLFVNRQNERLNGVPNDYDDDIDKDSELACWLEQLNELLDQVESLLKPKIASGQITFLRTTQPVSEEILGRYDAPMAYIMIGPSKIKIEPVGKFIIGAKGAAQIVGKMGKRRAVYVPESADSYKTYVQKAIFESDPATKYCWKIVSLPPKLRFLPIDQQSFEETVLDIV